MPAVQSHRLGSLVFAVGVFVFMACARVSGARGDATGAPSAGPPPYVSSVRDSPGYTPLVDPESSSVARGRRLHAPRVRQPFVGGTKSLNDLGRAVCSTLQHDDTDSLLRLCVTDGEFRDILWREFPQSRPAVGLTWMDAWRILYARQHAGCMHAVRDYGGRPCEFVRFELPDSTLVCRNFTLHSRLRMVVKNEQGQLETWQWLRAAVERHGRWKIYSTDD